MCGIIGIIGHQEANNIVISGMTKLEYRGYDSSGIAMIDGDKLFLKKITGSANDLKVAMQNNPIKSNTAIGHVRWATHGTVDNINAQPHIYHNIAIVHNGIIENYSLLKNELIAQGHQFRSISDSEVISVLIYHHMQNNKSFQDAFIETIKALVGNFAIAAIDSSKPKCLAVAKLNSPMILTQGDGVQGLASDINALRNIATKFINMNDYTCAFLSHEQDPIIIDYRLDKELQIPFVLIPKIDIESENNDSYKYHTEREIYQQPAVIRKLIDIYWPNASEAPNFNNINIPKNISSIDIIACGTSYNAGTTISNYMATLGRIPVTVHVASEFIHKKHFFSDSNLFIFISQSGETSDTVEAMKTVTKEHKDRIISIINAQYSTMSTLSDMNILCHAGEEVGVASTKNFAAQMLILTLLSLKLAINANAISKEKLDEIYNEVQNLPQYIENILSNASVENITKIASKISSANYIMFIGKDMGYGVSAEMALKVKEISYICTDAMPSGELKHGPLALITNNTPIIVSAIPDDTLNTLMINAISAMSRGAKLVVLCNKEFEQTTNTDEISYIMVPTTNSILSSILHVVCGQIMALLIGINRGCNIDKPRNLAKSVTVK